MVPGIDPSILPFSGHFLTLRLRPVPPCIQARMERDVERDMGKGLFNLEPDGRPPM